MKWFGPKEALVIVLLAIMMTMLYRATEHRDPEGISRRPPYSMHAHQSEWIENCQPGRKPLQSPISLTTTRLSDQKDSPIKLDLMHSKAELLDVGHTFQVRYGQASPGAKILFEDQNFELRQFHFHKPSEHLIDGKQYEMEAHFVFMNKNKSALPKAFVLGIMILDGSRNSEIAKIWKHLPPSREGYGESKVEMSDWKEAAGTNELEVDTHTHHEKVLATGIEFDITGLFPKKADFMIYDGSLTTPGCDEGITHAVSLSPIYMEHEQVEHFEGYYEGSNREVQPLGSITNRKFRRASVSFEKEMRTLNE